MLSSGIVATRLLYYQPTLVESAASIIMYPVMRTAYLVAYPFCATYHYIADVQASCYEYRAVKERLLDAEAELIRQYATADYHEQIRELVAFEYTYDMSKAICAQVMMRTLSPQAHECFVDAGSNKGVAVDMVAVYKNFLVGRVDQVYTLYSKIIFMTDPRCKIGVYMHETQASGICQGTCSEDTLMVRYINHLDVLKEGDMVLSRGQGMVYPQGFALGSVRAFTNSGVEYECQVTPLVKPSEITTCYLFAKG